MLDLLHWEILSDYSYSSTQVNLEDPVRSEVLDWAKKNIPDEDLYTEEENHGRDDTPHITVLYGILTQDPSDIIDLLEGTGTVEATLGKVSLFENSDDYDVVKISVESEDLTDLHELLEEKLDNENKFPDYQPHVTLAYVKKGKGKRHTGSTDFEGRRLTFNKVRFSTKKEKATFIYLNSDVEARLSWRP